MLLNIHHVAIICSNYPRSKHFYVDLLELPIINETYRESRQSYKLDLRLPNGAQLELFSFPNSPERLSYPEARGLRHIAFTVESISDAKQWLFNKGIDSEEIRIDEITGKQFLFFNDPDGLPIELYQNK